ncbi:hypothetical protein NMY3_01631 [Candidatus Nitrosocosmicus oleophilus]|uniref:Blue (type 1) copper domain-containing protein n=2 Tax=Candidatus Nitrosocosmicus oleophilus TaxID=1353260 RepID=A0A654LWI9_9ARCH|nr:hypothetical protein NMY3_01631 [Candidatus Nitrosocosmicus oleophilus]
MIFLAILILGFNDLDVRAQESNSTIVLNPGATNSDSQNPISSANVTVPAGTNVTWVNKDSSPHMLVSGSPEEGPDNIFYGDFFGTNENYTVTFDKPGLYSYYDPAWSHIRGEITVENPEFSPNLGSSLNTSSLGGIKENLVPDSNTNVDVTNSDGNRTNTENDSFSIPTSSFLSSFPSSATNDTSDQSFPPSSLASDQALSDIFNKVGPLLGLLMSGANSSSSSSSPLSSFSQSNESFGAGSFDNQSSFPSSTIQSASPDQALSDIFNKVGPLLGLLMSGGGLPSSSSSSPLSSFSQSNESFGAGSFDNQSSFPSSTIQSASPDQALSDIFNKVGPLLGLLMSGANSSSSSSSSPLSSFSQSDGVFGQGLMDTANFSNSESGDVLLSDQNSSSLLNDTFTLQNKSITLLDEERVAVQKELINILKKAYSVGAELPELPSFLDEGDNATIFIKVNVINPIDKIANASDFPIKINYEYGDGIPSVSYTYANDAGRIEAVPASIYAILADPSQTSDQGKDTFLNSYTTSYSKGCSGHIDYSETQDCVITKKYTDMTNNINITSGS